jgi:cysteine-S-conjugate beta-lyase
MAPQAPSPTSIPPEELPVDPLASLRSRRSAKWQTYPEDVLPLTVAEMDFAVAPEISAALHEAVERSDFAGRRWSWEIDPHQVTAVLDVGVGVVETLRVLITSGQRVAFSPPVYPPFFDWMAEAGATIVEVPLAGGPGGWRLDLQALERVFAAGVSVYVLCNPHNPVGRVHSVEELTALVDLARRHGTVIVSDEIHGPLVLPGATFAPLLRVPGAEEVAVTVMSASKAWNLAGLKCAAVVTASPKMAAVAERLPPDTRWRVGHLGVIATIAALRDGEPWLNRLIATLNRRRGQLTTLLAERLPAIRWQPPEATYLAWLDCRQLGAGDAPRDLFLQYGRVALEPGLRFGSMAGGYTRLNFATSTGILDQATARMAQSAAMIPRMS